MALRRASGVGLVPQRHVALDGHMPYPAVVIDRGGNLVSANDAFGALTTLTTFGAAVDVTVAELRLEAFLPADEATAALLAAAVR
jgi:hypothetical protein